MPEDGNDTAFPTAIWWLVVAWIAITISAALWGVPHEENDLRDRATLVLAGTGLTVDFEGRDAFVSGSADDATVAAGIASLQDLRGVRTVDASQVEIAAATPSPPTTTTAPPATTTTMPPTAMPTFTAMYEQPGIQLSGTLPDQATIDALLAAAQAQYGVGNAVSSMTVGDVAAPNALADLPAIFDLAQGLNPWIIELEEGTVLFRGQGPDQETVDQIRASVAELASGLGEFSSKVEVRPEVIARSLTELLAEGANFETGSAQLNAAAVARLDTVFEILVANPSAALRVEGHTDNVGDDASNLLLSEARAQAVVDYLVAAGIEARRLTAVGYGEARPIADNDTEEGRAINRRIEFVAERDRP